MTNEKLKQANGISREIQRLKKLKFIIDSCDLNSYARKLSNAAFDIKDGDTLYEFYSGFSKEMRDLLSVDVHKRIVQKQIEFDKL